jgi:hypothetical protein
MAIENISWLLLDPTNARVVGATPLPTILVRRVVDNFIYDWDDSTFKSTGWTTKDQDLSEVDGTNFPGVYETNLDIGDFDGLYYVYATYTGTGNGQSIVMEIKASNGSTMSTLVDELHEVHGLNAATPLVVNATSRTVGATIAQTIAESNGDVTVTRT